MNKLIFGVVLGAGLAAASAQAIPMKVDARTATQNDLTARLVRFNDPDAECPNYGNLVVMDDGQKVMGQKDICGAENMVMALQGDEVVVYVYARNPDGTLGMYRYIAARDAWSYHNFAADTITVTSMGTEVMVRGYYKPLPNEVKPRHHSWTWHPRMEEPKSIDREGR